MEQFPSMFRVRQRFDNSSVADVRAEVRKEFERLPSGRTAPGAKVAVAVGSRGIAELAAIVSEAVSCLRAMNLHPFILPAMGSHGGATAEGQRRMLDDLGVNEKTVGAPVVSDMEVVSLGRLASGAEVFFSRDAMEADYVAVINRVKPHTAFRSEVESGLCKMLAVGCGKHQGALNMHKFDLASSIVPAAEVVLSRAPILCGLAVVENSRETIHTVRLALPEEFTAVDMKLLKIARGLLPSIPLKDLDILLVEEMGKNISGAGIDTNVIGTWRRDAGPRNPDYRTLIVLDLTAQSHGNALGIGMVDLTTRRVVDRVDLKATYTNALTTGIWSSVRLPMALENDRAAIEAALSRSADPGRVRMARIKNSLMLETFLATGALVPELERQQNIAIDKDPLQLEFDGDGRLLPFSEH
jgi:hypothetical protein